MSLLSSASAWTNDEPKKRISTVRKTVKNVQFNDTPELKLDMNQYTDANYIPFAPNESRDIKVNSMLTKITSIESDGDRLADFNPPPNPVVLNKTSPLETSLKPENPNQYSANNIDLANYTNYNTSYIAKPPIRIDDKLLDKINYMIHMLESQQHENTANITEEFILYTFLGIFMIFIVDSFARAGGKYTR